MKQRTDKKSTIEDLSGRPSPDEVIRRIAQLFHLEKWDEDRTQWKQNLFLDSDTFKQTPLFDLPTAQMGHFCENYLVSPNGSYAYQNRVLPKARPLEIHGIENGVVVFNGDVTIPTLIDLTVDARNGLPFLQDTLLANRVEWGAVWMSLTPSEMLTQRPGILKAYGTVVIGGLGLGWFLKRVCEREFVKRVIVVERSQELLDWYGYDLCKRFPKVSDVICDDVFNQIGKHGERAVYLLDIWLLFIDAVQDERVRAARKELKHRLWVWGS